MVNVKARYTSSFSNFKHNVAESDEEDHFCQLTVSVVSVHVEQLSSTVTTFLRNDQFLLLLRPLMFM
jgi:hypothetical protein